MRSRGTDADGPRERSPFVSRAEMSDGRAIVERGHHPPNRPTHSSALYSQLLPPNDADPPSTAGTIRVRVHRCQDAFSREDRPNSPGYSTSRQYASYVVVHNETDRGQTSLVAGQLNPAFHEEFLLHTDNPMSDALVVTLVRCVQPSGGSGEQTTRSAKAHQKVAECCLSLEALIWKQERTFWVPLVRKAGTAEAVEQGEVQISLYSEDFGLDCSPVTAEEELTFYREVHSVLLRHSPQELHRVHWLVGHYLRKPQRWAQRKQTRYARVGSRPAGHRQSPRLQDRQSDSVNEQQRWSRAGLLANGVKVSILVKEVDGLLTPNGSPSSVETCCVTVSSASSCDTSRTTTEVYRRRALFEQVFSVTLRSPEDAVRFSVISADTTMGECAMGLFNIQAGRPSSMVLPLVITSAKPVVPFGSSVAEEEVAAITISGYLHITVCTEHHSTSLHYSARQADLLYQRVLAFLWCQRRNELYQLYPILSRLQGVEQGMTELVASAGTEPIPIRVQLRLHECSRLGDRLSRADVPCHVVVMAGPYRHRTRTVTTRGNGMLPIREVIELSVLNPSTAPCTLILVEERGSRRGVEVSRVTFGFSRMIHGQTQTRQLRLTRHAFSARATLHHEEISFDLTTNEPFGWDAQAVTPRALTADEVYLGRIEGMLRRQSPQEMHLARYWLDCTPFDHEDQLMNRLNDKYGDAIEAAPMTVQVLGIRNLRHDERVIVKVEMEGKVLLQTKAKPKGSCISYELSDNNEAVTTLHHAYQSSLTATVMSSATFGEGERLGHVEVSMRNLVRGEENILWLPMYSEEVVSGNVLKREDQLQYDASHVVPLGFLGLSLQSMAFPRATVIEYPTRVDAPLRPEEEVFRDVATLLLKQRPSDLPRLHPLVSEYPSLDLAHPAIRKKLSGNIGATVYLTVDSIHLYLPGDSKQEELGNLCVEITCGQEVHTATCMTEKLVGLPQRRFYPVMRLDIPPPPKAVVNSSATVFGRSTAPKGMDPHSAATMACPPLVITLLQRKHRGAQGKQTSPPPPPPPPPPPAPPEAQSTAGHPSKTSIPTSRDEALERNMNRLDSYRGTPSASLKMRSCDTSAITTTTTAAAPRRSFVSPPRPGVLSEVHLSIRALLTPSLYRMGDTVTLPLVRLPPNDDSNQTQLESDPADPHQHLVGSITFHLQPAAFDHDSSFSLDHHRNSSKGSGRLDPQTIQYYAKRILSNLQSSGSDDLVDFHYQLYESHVASGMWEQSLPAWANSSKRPHQQHH